MPQRWQCWFHTGGLSQGLSPCEGSPQQEHGRLGQSRQTWPRTPQRIQVGNFCWDVDKIRIRVRIVKYYVNKSTQTHKLAGGSTEWQYHPLHLLNDYVRPLMCM